jgi:hypothetical protein
LGVLANLAVSCLVLQYIPYTQLKAFFGTCSTDPATELWNQTYLILFLPSDIQELDPEDLQNDDFDAAYMAETGIWGDRRG